MIKVTLTTHEIHQCALAGVLRHIEQLRTPHAHGYAGDAEHSWGMDIEGAAAEFVVAKKRGLFWNAVVGVSDVRGLPGDVADLEVRSTSRSNGCLLLHESDPDDRRFILVTGAIPSLTIVGWMFGRDGKNPEWWRTDTGRPAFFVPQRALLPFGGAAAAA